MSRAKAHYLTQYEILTLRNSLASVVEDRLDNPSLPVRFEVQGSRLTFQVEGKHPLNMALDLKEPK